jgi:hypothetical protein
MLFPDSNLNPVIDVRPRFHEKGCVLFDVVPKKCHAIHSSISIIATL